MSAAVNAAFGGPAYSRALIPSDPGSSPQIVIARRKMPDGKWMERRAEFPNWPAAIRRVAVIIRALGSKSEQAAIEPTIKLMEEGALPPSFPQRTWAAESWYVTTWLKGAEPQG